MTERLPAPVSAAPENGLWYKDAVMYEMSVKSFYDSTGDGTGDFGGLRQKLGYLQDLGVDCIWLLPFLVSPLRDDGYDIADYYTVHPDYGTLDDFDAMIQEAHSRGIRVISDLVVSHVSDQHPWFQEARRDPASPRRNWFVWADNDQKYKGVRIIFVDSEKSNWTWDPVANQYYWHRFFSHQPDLNYDEPAVREEVRNIVRFWLKRGLDGFRVDAVPYLYEREGTTCENLPETHAFFRDLRTMIDEEFPGRILLAEANQWPADVRKYFGNEDEFHMAFNFPLMPRIFIALAREARLPIVDIINQTLPIPETCAWGIFLRNHDELTLEMVTDEERDFMYHEYAKHPKMRLNLGIRRRLSPLVDDDRRVIELLHGLLFSLPGVPILYYGDELGMGDNIYLGDRNGVRTPMQWSPDRNAGFSRADTELLYAPVVVNPNYHFESRNVEAERRLPTSLLNWVIRTIKIRHQYRHTFGRGSIRFINHPNHKALVYLRTYEDQTILCAFNLSRRPTALEIDLSEFQGHTPIEVQSDTPFPPIGELPYFLTLGEHAFFWFRLEPPSPGASRGSS
ncbi:MAG: maltose alpha-D-glucosyltransferase [Thermoplasmata archaeon]